MSSRTQLNFAYAIRANCLQKTKHPTVSILCYCSYTYIAIALIMKQITQASAKWTTSTDLNNNEPQYHQGGRVVYLMEFLWQPSSDHYLSVSICNRTDTGSLWRKDPFNPIPLVCEFPYNLVVKIKFEVFNYKPVLYSIFTMFVIYYNDMQPCLF